MKTTGIPIKGFTIKGGKVKRIAGYGLSASAKLQRKASKRVRPVRKGKANVG